MPQTPDFRVMLGDEPADEDGLSTDWGLGTLFRVTVDMDLKSNYEIDVCVVDVNSVKSAR